MFRNSGKKIMVVAKILFWLNLLLALGAAAVVVFLAYDSYGVEMALLAALAAAAAVVCYMLLAYVQLLLLSAFGELCHSNVELRRILAENRRAPERPVYVPPVPERVPTAREPVPEEPFPEWRDMDFRPSGTAAAPFPVPAPAEKPQEPAPKPAPRAAAFGMVYCRRCGAKHEPGVAKCRYCGTPLY